MTKAEREKQREREVIVSRLKLILIVTCLFAIPITFWVNHGDVGSLNRRVTKVESPCLRFGPNSSQCKEAFEAAVSTITHPEACAIERKAGTLRAIRELAQGLHVDFKEPCAGARIAQERQRGNERAAAAASTGPSTQAGGGVALAPGNSGSGGGPGQHGSGGHPGSGPGKGGSEGGGGPSQGGSGEAPAPGSGGNSGEGQAPNPPSKEPSSAGAVVPSTVEAAGNAAGEVVGKAGDAVQGTLEGAGHAGCGLLGSC